MVTHVENDVYKLSGIGPRYTEMLEGIGVDSIKELRHRVPEHLFAMIRERHGYVVGLSVKGVAGWIEQAKAWKQ
jgi:hypothetical protein